MTTEPSLVLDARAELGEGPLWDSARQRLLFVDVMSGRLHVFDPAAGSDRVIHVGRPIGAVACTTRGDWVVAAAQGFFCLDPDTERLTPLAEAAPGRAAYFA